MNAGITFYLSLGGWNRTIFYVWERYFTSISDFTICVEGSFVVAVAKNGWMVSS